jgi:hypothetical protein
MGWIDTTDGIDPLLDKRRPRVRLAFKLSTFVMRLARACKAWDAEREITAWDETQNLIE